MHDERGSWDSAWADATFEDEIGTLSYEWVQPALAFIAPHLVPNASILEAGCGPGRFLYWLREQGYRAVGVDCSLAALAKGRRYSADFRLALADVCSLPFRAEAFGTCLSFGVIEHLPDGPDECLAEMRRVLAPGGVLIISVPHRNLLAVADPPLKRVYRALRRIPVAGPLEPPGRHLPAGELTAALARAGFEILETMPFGHAYSLHSFCGWFRRRGAYHDVTPLAAKLGRLLSRLAPWSTASTVFAAARKPTSATPDGVAHASRH